MMDKIANAFLLIGNSLNQNIIISGIFKKDVNEIQL